MKKVYFYTLGCKVNQYDTETMRAGFGRLGFESVAGVEDADVCVVNTCSVTRESDRKCRSQVRRLRRLNPEVFMVATGCYASGTPNELDTLPEVDLVVTHMDRMKTPLDVLDALGLRCPDELAIAGQNGLSSFAERTRAFVKIEDGCSQMCTFCRIPFYRGRVKSRLTDEVLHEIRQLAGNGYREIVLCGIQLGAFGRDTGESFPDLLRSIDDIPGIARFRLSSIEPDDVTDELVEVLTTLPKSAPHLHLPIQSADDGILKRMRRRYDYAFYKRLVDELRSRIADFAVSADLMVGFPGESEQAFRNSVSAVREIQYCRLHIFRFSARPGTKAATYPDQLPKEVIDRRRHELDRVAREVVESVRRRQLGTLRTVLLEESGPEPGSAVGFSENYLRVMVLPNGEASETPEQRAGDLVRVRIESLDPAHLVGKLAEESAAA